MRAISAREEREHGNPEPTYPYTEKDEKDRDRAAAEPTDKRDA
jgi:hypothetical protein